MGESGQRPDSLEMHCRLRMERENNRFLGDSLKELSTRHAQYADELLALLSQKEDKVPSPLTPILFLAPPQPCLWCA